MNAEQTVNRYFERISKIPTNNLRVFFNKFRQIVDELNAEYDKNLEEMFYVQNELKCIRTRLKTRQNDLEGARNKITAVLSEYLSKCEIVLDIFIKDDDLRSKTERISHIEEKLSHLRILLLFLKSIEELKQQLDCENYSAVFSTLSELLGIHLSYFGGNDDESKKVIDEIMSNIHTALQSSFDKIGFPFEQRLDLQTQYATAENQIVWLIKCVCIFKAEDRKQDIECDDVADLLLDRFKKRFYFHFQSGRKTNDISKPEWYFTQILTWIGSNIEFIERISKDFFVEDKTRSTALIYDFAEKLLVVVAMKVRHNLTKVFDQSQLFSHLIDECVMFENDLHDSGLVSSSLVGQTLSVVCEKPFFERWLSLEQNTCTLFVENLLIEESKWGNRYSNSSDVDLHRVPECADGFILLLESITARFRWISCAKRQAKFLELQIVLLDEFRLRLVQISQELSSPWKEPFIQILNSLWFIAHTLDTWNGIDIFIRIQIDGKRIYDRGSFDDVIDLYRHSWQQRCDDMIRAFQQQTRAHLGHYEKVNWFAFEEVQATEISSTFFPYIFEVRTILSKISSAISPDTSLMIYQILNQKIAECFLNLIDSLSFNCHGASQMLFDVSFGLMNLLNSFYCECDSSSIEAIDEPRFVDVIESLSLLSLPLAVAILLQDELKRTPDEAAPSLLLPHNITSMSRVRALNLFTRRRDLLSKIAVNFTW